MKLRTVVSASDSTLIFQLCANSLRLLAGSSCNDNSKREFRYSTNSSSTRCCTYHRLFPRAGNIMRSILGHCNIYSAMHTHSVAYFAAHTRRIANGNACIYFCRKHIGLRPASQLCLCFNMSLFTCQLCNPPEQQGFQNCATGGKVVTEGERLHTSMAAWRLHKKWARDI